MSRTGFSIAGLLLAGVAAPPISVTIFLALAGLLPETSDQRLPAADIPMAYMVATLMGVIPSLVFGGLTLLAMKQVFKAWPPRPWIMAAGGAVAAAAYCMVSTLVGFAPWGALPIEDLPGTSLMAGCVLLSGVAAGSIYAPFAARG